MDKMDWLMFSKQIPQKMHKARENLNAFMDKSCEWRIFPLPFESFVWILTNRNMSNQNWNNLLSSSKFYLKANTGKMLTITPDGFLIPLSQRGGISNLTPGAERVQIDLRSISVIKTQGRRCSFWNKPILAQLNFVTNWSNNAIPKANGSGWQ